MSYQDYQLKEATRRFIAYQRFTEPTMIQQAVIPYACKGKDIIGDGFREDPCFFDSDHGTDRSNKGFCPGRNHRADP